MVRKRELAIGVSILIIATLAFLLGWTNLFTVRAIAVTGSPNSAVTAEVLRISQIETGAKLARLEPKKIATRLLSERLNWVERADISRNWLTRKVEITLKARSALAVIQSGNSSVIKFVDQSGAVFELPEEIRSGVKADLIAISGNSDAARAAGIALYQGLPRDLSGKVIKVVATSQSNFQLLQGDGLRIVWGSAADTSLKVRIYKALIALPENAKIKYMDLSNPIKPTVK